MTQQNTQAVILQQPNGEKLQVELKITEVANDTTAMASFEKGADISIASFDSATYIAVSLALFATGLAYWFGVKSFKLTKQGFELTLEQIGQSVRQTLNSNKELYQSQEKLKIRELIILNKSTTLDKVKDLICENFYLAGNLQNQIEIAIEEIRVGKPDKYFHSRNFGEFKTTLNSYQSSINKIMVYLENDDSHYYEEINEHLRKIQLLSWNLYTADINLEALKSGLRDWGSEYQLGRKIIQNYLKHEFDKIYKI